MATRAYSVTQSLSIASEEKSSSCASRLLATMARRPPVSRLRPVAHASTASALVSLVWTRTKQRPTAGTKMEGRDVAKHLSRSVVVTAAPVSVAHHAASKPSFIFDVD